MAKEKAVRVKSYEEDISIRVRAMESLLTEKGIVDTGGIDEIVDFFQTKIGPQNGAKVVAKAWADPEYKKWLLEDGTAAVASLGKEFVGLQGEHMKVVENTPEVHHLITCTLCSCYAWPTLGFAADVLQVALLSRPLRQGAPRGPEGVWRRASRGDGDPRLGQQFRASLHGGPHAPGRDRGDERGGTRGSRHARLHAWYRLGERQIAAARREPPPSGLPTEEQTR